MIEPRRDHYIFTVFGLKGVGGKVYIGEVRDKTRLEVEKMCHALKLELEDTFPRGISYEMMEYHPEVERKL